MQSPDVPLRVTLDATPLIGDATGIGVFTSALVRELKANEKSVELSAFAMTGRNVKAISNLLPNTQHNTVPMPAGLLSKAWSRASFPPIDLWMKPGSVVHGTNFVVPPTRKAARLVTVHDLTSVRFPELCNATSLRYPKLVERAVKNGAHVHTLTKAVAQDVEELLNVPSERIHIIPPGVDARAEAKQHESTSPYIFAIGTIEPRKDYPTLISAFDKLATKLKDVELLIAGASGWGMSDFKSALDAAKHRDRIKVLGRINDDQYMTYLRGASVLAYPSIYEGFGYPPLEAMSANVPVVASNVASLPEVCGDAALLVETRNPDALAASLESVLTDVSIRDELIRKGCQQVARFQWKDAGTKFVELYKELAT